MELYNNLKTTILKTKDRLKENNFDTVLWVVDTVPNIFGFSIFQDEISPWFWIVHIFMLYYIYGVGNLVYQYKYAEGAQDVIKSCVNISLLILTSNISWWWLTKRKILQNILKKLAANDEMARKAIYLKDKHEWYLKLIKRVVFIYFSVNVTDAIFIYLPHRVDINDEFSMTLCVGLEPLTSFPNRQICLFCLAYEELAIMIVVLNYQALLMVFIAHSAAMYEMLAYELEALNENEEGDDTRTRAKERLPFLIERHSLTLDIVDQIKELYSTPLGINFATNAACMSLFFYLPLEECLQFIPILVYCFVVFFLYCFLCQLLVNSSEMFERSVYCCGWENFNVPEKKLVYTMLRQSQKPVAILAADIIPVNMYTFATTMQAMFKFVTVMKF